MFAISHCPEPVACKWCLQTSCYCCPECGHDVRDEHDADCQSDPEKKIVYMPEQTRYIQSVQGKAHMSAVRIIGDLENETVRLWNIIDETAKRLNGLVELAAKPDASGIGELPLPWFKRVEGLRDELGKAIYCEVNREHESR